MRSIGLILLVIGVFSWAEQPPVDETPPPPRVMEIHMFDGSIDSIFCLQVDEEVGVSFNRFQMIVGIIELDAAYQPMLDPVTQVPIKSTRVYCTSNIESITFPLFIPPVPPVTQ